MRLIKHSKSQMVFKERRFVGMIIGIGFLVISGPIACAMVGTADGPGFWGVLVILPFVAIGAAMVLCITHSEVWIFDRASGVVRLEHRRWIGAKIDESPLSEIIEIGNVTTDETEDEPVTHWVVLKRSTGDPILVNDRNGRDQDLQSELAATMRAFLRLAPASTTDDDPGEVEPR
jgi:hypothetical protein